MSRAPHRRGMSLIELMVSCVILVTAIAITSSLVLSGAQMAFNAEQTGESYEAARLGEMLTETVRRAGLGAAGGLWVAGGAGQVRIHPVFGVDGTTGAGTANGTAVTDPNGWDDLWVVVPSPNAHSSCSANGGPGAAATVLQENNAALKVNCVQTFSTTAPSNLLMVTNLKSAALIRATTLTAAPSGTQVATIDFTETNVVNDAPEGVGYRKGDLVFGATIFHYYLKSDADHPLGLYRSTGTIGTDPTTGNPFVDVAGTEVQLAPNVEDLQIAYGFDNGMDTPGQPDRYAFQDGAQPAYDGRLRTVRISVVARGTRTQKGSDQLTSSLYQALSVENHTPAGATFPPGFLRSRDLRRVELPNLLPVNL